MSLNIDGGGSVKINDNITSSYSTWSSSKIVSSGGGGGGTNTLSPVLITNPQVEKNIETKTDNSNALVVLQPTIGDTEIYGGSIKINNISKDNFSQYNERGLNHTGSYITPTSTAITNTISLKSDETNQNLPTMIIQAI